MAKQRTPTKHTCIDCGENFYSISTQVLRCPECRAKYKKEYEKIYKKENPRRKKRKISRGMPPSKSISQVLRELEAYNKEHGTWLSYGQYIAMIEN
jgi:predicted  nucleic acid-binding Zn-ribbon protein